MARFKLGSSGRAEEFAICFLLSAISLGVLALHLFALRELLVHDRLVGKGIVMVAWLLLAVVLHRHGIRMFFLQHMQSVKEHIDIVAQGPPAISLGVSSDPSSESSGSTPQEPDQPLRLVSIESN